VEPDTGKLVAVWQSCERPVEHLREVLGLVRPAARSAEHEVLDDHFGIRARLRYRRRDRQRIVGDPDARKLLARRAQPDHHPAATMKVDTDVLSIHRGLLLFVRGLVVRTPSLERLGPSRGAEAPLLHRIRSVSTRDRSVRLNVSDAEDRRERLGDDAVAVVVGVNVGA
jgi:hypothetical protein